MKVLITGTFSGIGYETAKLFLCDGHEVYGIDIKPSSIDHPNYHHIQASITDSNLPEIDGIEIIINNAGVQNSDDDIEVNLKGTINVTEKYAFQSEIKSVLFNASSSAHTGFEFPRYSASKGGILAYMKNAAWRLAKEYKATCNSISLGGVHTSLNDPVVNDKETFEKIMDVTPLKKWMDVQEVAEWFYFLTVINKSCTGQDIVVDNGEKDLNCTFVWPNF